MPLKIHGFCIFFSKNVIVSNIVTLSHNANILMRKEICRSRLCGCVVCAERECFNLEYAWHECNGSSRSTHREGNRSGQKIIDIHTMNGDVIDFTVSVRKTNQTRIIRIIGIRCRVLGREQMDDFLFSYPYFDDASWWQVYFLLHILGIFRTSENTLECDWSAIEVLDMLKTFGFFSIHVCSPFWPLEAVLYPIFNNFELRANFSMWLSDSQCASILRPAKIFPTPFSFHCKMSKSYRTMRKKWKMISLQWQDFFFRSQLTSVEFP